MDILRLPASLRQSIASSNWLKPTYRSLSTHAHQTASPPDPYPSEAFLTLSPNTLNSYTTTSPPNNAQLKYAHHFFHSTPPTLLYTAAHFRSLPPSANPEVAFLGRSNVGKSSLLNALFGRPKTKDAHVSKRPGRTRTMNGFGVTGPGLSLGAAPKTGDQKEVLWRRFPRGGLVVVDMPGYGRGSREVWGQEVLKYLERRKQLRRTFVLIDAEHGLKASDMEILMHLRKIGVGHQIVLSKVDKVLFAGAKAPGPQRLHNKLMGLRDMCDGIRQRLDVEAGDGRGGVGDILCCSAEKGIDGHRKLGIDEVRWSVLSACGMDSDESGQKRQYRLSEIDMLDEDD